MPACTLNAVLMLCGQPLGTPGLSVMTDHGSCTLACPEVPPSACFQYSLSMTKSVLDRLRQPIDLCLKPYLTDRPNLVTHD